MLSDSYTHMLSLDFIYVSFSHTHRLRWLWGGVDSKQEPNPVTLQWVMDGGVSRTAAPYKHSCSVCLWVCVVVRLCGWQSILFLSVTSSPPLYSSIFPLTFRLSDILASTLQSLYKLHFGVLGVWRWEYTQCTSDAFSSEEVNSIWD